MQPDPPREATSGHAAPARGRRIAFMNQKGGVGKTTTTVNLGAALTELGCQVLMIDLDPQAHMSLSLGVEPEAGEPTLYELLSDEAVSVFEVIREVTPRLGLLPGDVNLAGIESELAAAAGRGVAQERLKKVCEPLLAGRPFDYVLIDCPPSLGLLTVSALSMVREVIVPMQAHFLALQGMSKLLETIGMVRQRLNPALRVAGMMLCMHDAQTVLAQEIRGDLDAFLDSARAQPVAWRHARVYEPAVRRNIKLAEAPSFGQTIFQYEPHCAGARDYAALARALHEAGETPDPLHPAKPPGEAVQEASGEAPPEAPEAGEPPAPEAAPPGPESAAGPDSHDGMYP